MRYDKGNFVLLKKLNFKELKLRKFGAETIPSQLQSIQHRVFHEKTPPLYDGVFVGPEGFEPPTKGL